MESTTRERAFLVISVSSEEVDWWGNHSHAHRLPEGSIRLGSHLIKCEVILPEDQLYEDPQLEPLRSTDDASLWASSHWGTGLQMCSRVQSQAERLV